MGGEQWVTGMLLNLVGSTTINFGTNLLKYSHLLNEGKTKDDSAENKKAIWLSGFVLFIVGNAFNFLSFGYAAQSLLAAIGSVQFISNVLFAACLLNEKVTRKVVEGTLGVVVGNTFALIFASHDSKNYSVDEIQEMFTRTPFLLYLVFVSISVVGLSVLYSKAKKKIKDNLPSKQMSFIIPLCYAGTSGMIGSLSVLLAKSTSQLVRTSFSGDNQFKYGFAYYMLFGWILLTVYWLQRLNSGLRKFPSMVIVPALQVFWTIFSIIGGGIFFNEFAAFKPVQSVGFLSGVLIIIGSVMHLSSHHDDSVNPKELIETLKLENDIIAQAIIHENMPTNSTVVDKTPALHSRGDPNILGGLG